MDAITLAATDSEGNVKNRFATCLVCPQTGIGCTEERIEHWGCLARERNPYPPHCRYIRAKNTLLGHLASRLIRSGAEL